MTGPIDDYLKRVDEHLTIEPAERHQVLSELRSHLWETANALQREAPERAMDDIQRQVVDDFGSPADLALAYNPEGSVVLTDASGRAVMTFSAGVTRAGRAAGEAAAKGAKAMGKGAAKSAHAVGKGAWWLGRGVGGFLKVLVLSLVILLAVALLSASLVAVFLFDDIKQLIEENAGASVYSGDFDACSTTPCNGTLEPKRFYVDDGVQRLRFWISGHAGGNETTGGGTLLLTVRDPGGVTVMDLELDMSPREHAWETGFWAAREGYWELDVRYVDFQGRFEFRVDAVGLFD